MNAPTRTQEQEKIVKTKAEWRKQPTPGQYNVTCVQPTEQRYCMNGTALAFKAEPGKT